MSVGSSVSLAWAVQVETVPLIFAAKSHASYLNATRFFSLLALRSRSGTLAFIGAKSSPARHHIGSWPPEVVGIVLSHVFAALAWEARQNVIDAVGMCCQFDEHHPDLPMDHVCGLEKGCYEWNGCCKLKDDHEDDEEVGESFYEREDAFRQKLGDEYAKEINKALSYYSLRLISIPSSFPYQDPPSPLDRTVIGIPFLPGDFKKTTNPSLSEVKLSELEPTEDNDELVEVIPLPGVPEITDEEKDRFVGARRGLKLVFGYAAKTVWARKKVVKEGELELDEEEDNGIGEEEPRLMVVHSGWCSY